MAARGPSLKDGASTVQAGTGGEREKEGTWGGRPEGRPRGVIHGDGRWRGGVVECQAVHRAALNRCVGESRTAAYIHTRLSEWMRIRRKHAVIVCLAPSLEVTGRPPGRESMCSVFSDLGFKGFT